MWFKTIQKHNQAYHISFYFLGFNINANKNIPYFYGLKWNVWTKLRPSGSTLHTDAKIYFMVERIASVGLIETQLRALLKPLNTTIVFLMYGGFQGCPQLGSHDVIGLAFGKTNYDSWWIKSKYDCIYNFPIKCLIILHEISHKSVT